MPNKMQHVLCTGNMGSKKQFEELRSLAPNVHVVAGNYEYNSPIFGSFGDSSLFAPGPLSSQKDQQTFPETKVIQVGEVRVGLIHGHQVIPWGDHMALAMFRRRLDVDVLISGHTHKTEVTEHDGYYHINPVSR